MDLEEEGRGDALLPAAQCRHLVAPEQRELARDNPRFPEQERTGEHGRPQHDCAGAGERLAPRVTGADQDQHREEGERDPSGIFGEHCQGERYGCPEEPRDTAPGHGRNRGIGRQGEKEHCRHVDQHEGHLGVQVRHAEEKHRAAKARGPVPQGLPHQVRQNYGSREEQRIERLDREPRLPRQAEQKAVEKRHQRQIGPGGDLLAPLVQKMADAEKRKVLRLHEVACGIHDHLRLAPEGQGRKKSENAQRRRGTVRRPRRAREPVGEKHAGCRDGQKRGQIGGREHPLPAHEAVVIEPAERKEKRQA